MQLATPLPLALGQCMKAWVIRHVWRCFFSHSLFAHLLKTNNYFFRKPKPDSCRPVLFILFIPGMEPHPHTLQVNAFQRNVDTHAHSHTQYTPMKDRHYNITGQLTL